MPHIDVSADHLLLALVALIVWAVRLEAKVLNSKKDLNGLGKRSQSMLLDLTRLETRYNSEHPKCSCEVSDDKKI